MAKELGDLTEKQECWLNRFFANGFNSTEAAEFCLYSGPNSHCWDIKQNKNMKVAIKRRFAEMRASADEVLARLSEQARGEYAMYFKCDGSIDFEKLVEEGKGHLIKKITPNREGLSVEFYNAQGALELLGRAQGLFRRRVEVSGPDGGPIQTEQVKLSSEEELRRLKARQRILERQIEEESLTKEENGR